MKLYSNKLLTWPSVLHLSTISRLYPGKWFNYNIYNIYRSQPLIIQSYSPISKLNENHQYYCYYKYNRTDIFETPNRECVGYISYKSTEQYWYDEYGNRYDIYDAISIPRIKLPKTIQSGDVIVIHDLDNTDAAGNTQSSMNNVELA